MHKLYFLIAGLLFSSLTNAQNAADLEFYGRPYYCTSTDSTVKKLEWVNAAVKPHYQGNGTTEIYLTTHHKKSLTHLHPSDSIKFYVKFTTDADPSATVELVKGRIEHHDRIFFFAETNKRGYPQKNTKDLPLTFKKLAEGFYEVSVTGKLEPGEYAFMPLMENGEPHSITTEIKISCFGIY